MAKQHWLAKSEPSTYGWDQLVEDRRTEWDGVRNFEARNHLRGMKKGDPVLFYHSVHGKEVVGIAKVVREAYPDPTAKDGDWSCVDVAPVKKLERPVSLAEMKADPGLQDLLLLRRSRLSVMPVTDRQFKRILKLGKTGL